MGFSILFIFALLLTASVPICFSLILLSFLILIFMGFTGNFMMVPQMLVGGIQSYLLMAVPLFMLAGSIMNEAGTTDRLFTFIRSIIGHVRGGLAHVNVLASLVFAGMSGSAVADSGGLGMIEIKSMRDQGYDPEFSAAITASSSTVGPIFPPSIPMVIYGGLANVSIARLFVGGVIPAFIMCLYLMIVISIIAKKRGYPRDEKSSIPEIWKSFKEAFLALITPVIIMGGILFGVFTPTEAAAVAVLYASFLGFFVYKTLTLKKLIPVFGQVAINTATVMIIIAATAPFKWLIAFQKIPDLIYANLTQLTNSPYVLLFILNLIFLGLGCIMDNTAIIILSVPVLLPVINHFGIDPVHFGVVMILNLMIGLLTPPVGMCIYTTCSIAKISLEKFIKENMVFFIALIIALFTITYVPGFVTWLPDLILKRF